MLHHAMKHELAPYILGIYKRLQREHEAATGNPGGLLKPGRVTDRQEPQNTAELRTAEGTVTVEPDEIMRFRAERNDSWSFSGGSKQTKYSMTLKELEYLLFSLNFIRINNSCLVNIAQICRFNININKRTGYVLLNDGIRITISRTRLKNMNQVFDFLIPDKRE